MNITYLPQAKIDKLKWDACIDAATNGIIYANSFYLDAMCKKWSALIAGDYEIVMPLTWNKKFGIAYLYQPPFTQQLGIFGKEMITDEIRNSFIKAAQQKFKFAEISVNFDTGKEKANFILSLNQSHELLQKAYKKTLLKSLKHTSKFSFTYKQSDDADEAINLYKKHYSKRISHVTKINYDQFKNVCVSAKKNNNLLIRKVHNYKNETIAITLLLKDSKRLYNIISVVTKAGKQSEANYFLYDNIIKEFAENNLLLDFEGSSIESIASFYKKFGAVNHPYFFLRFNNLPWPLKYLK